MPRITIGITELHEILGRDYGIEEPYWGTCVYHAMMNYRQANVEKRHWPRMVYLWWNLCIMLKRTFSVWKPKLQNENKENLILF